MIIKKFLIFCFCVFPVKTACLASPLAELDFKESFKNRTFAEESLDVANSILPKSKKFTLIPSWKSTNNPLSGKVFVAVYLVEDTQPNFVLQVPFRSCKCILIQINALRDHIFNYSEKNKQIKHSGFG